MTPFDLIVLIIFLGFLARGIWTGFIRQIAFPAAIMLGFVCAGTFYDRFDSLVAPLSSDPAVRFLITFVCIFVLVYIGVILLGIGLKKVVQITFLNWFDRTMGGLLGALKALCVTCLVFMILSVFLSGTNPFLRKAYTYPHLSNISEFILTFVKDEKLRSQFLPKKPAISSMLPALAAPVIEAGKKVWSDAKEKSKN
ncbi:MAG: CvpA family protein [Desulfobulbaceae bacterium]|nr:CvpA family protein [Desulfobulbaceae bacterium]